MAISITSTSPLPVGRTGVKIPGLKERQTKLLSLTDEFGFGGLLLPNRNFVEAEH